MFSRSSLFILSYSIYKIKNYIFILIFITYVYYPSFPLAYFPLSAAFPPPPALPVYAK